MDYPNGFARDPRLPASFVGPDGTLNDTATLVLATGR